MFAKKDAAFIVVFFLIWSQLSAQQVVSGVVFSETDASPLAGASVSVKETHTGVTTDSEGRYTIQVQGASAVLVFSYAGYSVREVQVNGQRTIDVILQFSSAMLDEVVVTALGIGREKKSLGYSVGLVDGKELVQVTQENIFGGLAARVPGISLNQISGPGSSVSMVIRGANSLTTDNQPLFVVDGVPVASGLNNQRQMGDRNIVDYGNAISDINPDDVESISVLKGPAAAALYGSRAGNGVVLIKTKAGSPGKTSINFSTSNVFEVPVRFLDFHYKYASGNRGNLLDESSAYWAGPPLDQGIKAVQWNSPVDENGVRIPTELVSYKDNMKNFLRTGITLTNNLSASGGNERGNYRFSFNNMTHGGMIPNSDLYRNSFSITTRYSLGSRLRLGSNIDLVRSSANSRPATTTRTANPLDAVLAYPHVNISDLKDYWVSGLEQIQQKTVSASADNPWFLAYELTNGFVRDRVFGNLKLDWQITPEISAFGRIALNKSDENRETKVPKSYSRAAQGGYYLHAIQTTELNADFLVSYKKVVGEVDMNLTGGGNFMRQASMNNFMGGSRLTIPGLYRISNIPASLLEYSNSVSNMAIYSYYAMGSLGYKNAVFMDFTLRNDMASTLPVSTRSFYYPSASLSWLVNETFKLPENIDILKLRGGWARVGSAPGPYQIHQMLSIGQYGDLITSTVQPGLRNPALKPEIATSSEFGLELNMFRNGLRFEGTYYKAGNRNQQLPVPLPESSGFSSILANAGLIESQGWELALGITPFRNKSGFTWKVDVNFYRNQSFVRELAEGFSHLTLWFDNDGGSFAGVGEVLGNLYSKGYVYVKDPASPYYRWPVLDNQGRWIENNSGQLTHVGNFNPDFQMGFQTTLTYKRLSLAANIDWRKGGEFMSFTYRYGGSNWKSGEQMAGLIPGGLYSDTELAALLKSNPEKYIIPRNGYFPRVGGYDQASGGYYTDDEGSANKALDGAFIPGVIDNGDGTYTEHLGGEGTVIHPISDLFPWRFNQAVIFDASFVKLREIALGYDLSEFKSLKKARISLFFRNLMLWTAAGIGIDPERAFQSQPTVQGNTSTMLRQGIELQNILPMTASIGFKLDITF